MRRVDGVAVVACVALLAAACVGGDGPDDDATPYVRPTPTPAPSPAGPCKPDAGPLPDPSCTPGAVLPTVDDDAATGYANTLCKPRWTATIRPPTSYTNTVKAWELNGDRTGKRRLAVAKYADADPGDLPEITYGPYAGDVPYVLDHVVPLSLGGHPSAVTNLFLMPADAAKEKDAKEGTAHDWVCAAPKELRPSRLQTAVAVFIFDWRQIPVRLVDH
jgi:hypothetical protein